MRFKKILADGKITFTTNNNLSPLLVFHIRRSLNYVYYNYPLIKKIMKQSFTIIALITILFLNSCVKSLHPLTDNPKDMIFKKELLGKWKDAKDNTEYIVDTFANISGKKYALTVIDHSNDKSLDTCSFSMMLINLKGHYFVDCSPDTSDQKYSKISDATKSLLLVSHFFTKVYSIGENLITISTIDNDALSLLLKTNKIEMEFQKINGNEILLLDKPKALQQKLIELEKFPSVYKKKDSLIRISN